MISMKQTWMMLAALGLVGGVPGEAAADYCYGDETEWQNDSECTDPETGATAKAGYSNAIRDTVMLGLYVGMPTGPRRASDWAVAGWTFDADGSLIDECSFVVTPPDTYKVEYEIEACQDAVTIQAFGDFTL